MKNFLKKNKKKFVAIILKKFFIDQASSSRWFKKSWRGGPKPVGMARLPPQNTPQNDVLKKCKKSDKKTPPWEKFRPFFEKTRTQYARGLSQILTPFFSNFNSAISGGFRTAFAQKKWSKSVGGCTIARRFQNGPFF